MIELIAPDNIPQLVEECSWKYHLNAEVVAAVIVQESSGDVWAYRWEPDFYKRKILPKGRQLAGHIPRKVSFASEQMARSTSWGLMQILGETARSMLSFKNEWLPVLWIPEVNIELGCSLLRKLLDRVEEQRGDLSEEEMYWRALRLYNGARAYPPLIFEHIREGRHLEYLPKKYTEKKNKRDKKEGKR